MMVVPTYHALSVSNKDILEARAYYEDGGRYLVDEDEVLLSRFSADEMASILFDLSDLQAVYSLNDEEYTYYVGALVPLS